MKALTFTLINPPEERLDLSILTPSTLAELTRNEIAKLRIGTSRRPASVGDLFKITGSDPANIIFEGGHSRFDGVASGMTGGSIRLVGDAGNQIARAMTGGSLYIGGSVGKHAGSGMTGGRVEVRGNAGDNVGGPLAGEITGMDGGVLIIRGKAGDYAGDRLRRGTIALCKGCGDYPGYRMIAGTIVILGRSGIMPGYLMKRGTLLFDRQPEHLSPTFLPCGEPDSPFAGLLDRYLISEKITDRALLGARPGKFAGDNAVSGKGEILYRKKGR